MGHFAGNIVPDLDRKVLFYVLVSMLSAVSMVLRLAAIGQTFLALQTCSFVTSFLGGLEMQK